MTINPYTTHKGFGLRVYRAEHMLRQHAFKLDHDIHSRSFDNCFEMFDGDAVVFALMDKAKSELAQTGSSTLAVGINRLFSQTASDSELLHDWDAFYQESLDSSQLVLTLNGEG